jgi:hypothetical protein
MGEKSSKIVPSGEPTPYQFCFQQLSPRPEVRFELKGFDTQALQARCGRLALRRYVTRDVSQFQNAERKHASTPQHS